MTEPFTNDPLPIDDLPQLTDDAFVSVDPRYLRASLLGTAVTASIVLIGGSLLAWRGQETLIIGGITAAILLLIALTAAARVLEVRRLAYQVREHDISLRSGLITHRVASLPFARVQHVRVNRGAIERALGLATLHISSAGPNIVIPGLAEAEASRVKLLVTQRAGMELEEEQDSASAGNALVYGGAVDGAAETSATMPSGPPMMPPTTPPMAAPTPPVVPPPPTPPAVPPPPSTPPVS